MVDKGWAYTLLLYILSFIQLSLRETNYKLLICYTVFACVCNASNSYVIRKCTQYALILFLTYNNCIIALASTLTNMFSYTLAMSIITYDMYMNEASDHGKTYQ